MKENTNVEYGIVDVFNDITESFRLLISKIKELETRVSELEKQ